MKLSCSLIASLLAIVASFQSAAAQAPDKALPETRIVLRVSGDFIQKLVGRSFQRDEQIDTQVGGVAVEGAARVAGKFRVVLHESQTDSEFDVLARGDVVSQLTATRRPVVVQAHGSAPFCATRRIVHEGDLFVGRALTMDVCNHFTLDEIDSFRGGLRGALTRRVARPFVRRGLADGDCYADDEIRTQMAQALESELDKLVLALNQIAPLVKQAHELIILENKVSPESVQMYRAATSEHLLFSIGPPEHRIPDLPNLDKDKKAPLELWIAVSRNARKEERRKLMLKNWRLIVPFLSAQLQRRSPELTKELQEPLAHLLDEIQIHEMPGWHVITFAPKIAVPIVENP